MIHGSLVAIVTPFKNGEIDDAAFRKADRRARFDDEAKVLRG